MVFRSFFKIRLLEFSIFGLSMESMDLWIRLRSYVRTLVPIFRKIRALEFSYFLYWKMKKMSKKVRKIDLQQEKQLHKNV